MLLFPRCNGACVDTTIALATCSHACQDVGIGYRIDYTVRQRRKVNEGSFDCSNGPLAPIDVGNASTGLYRVDAKLVDTQTNSVVESMSILALYDPDAVEFDADTVGSLHVLDPKYAVPVSMNTSRGKVLLPTNIPSFLLLRRNGRVRLVSASGGEITDTGYSDLAVLRLKIAFNDWRGVVAWLFTLAGRPLIDVFDIVTLDCDKIKSHETAISVAQMYAMNELLNSGVNVVGFNVDRDNNTITIDVAYKAGGLLGLDLKRLLGFTVGGCAIGAAVSLIGGPITLAAAAMGCFVGALVGATVDIVAQGIEDIGSTLTDTISVLTGTSVSSVAKVIDNSMKSVDSSLAKIQSDIDNACASGDISQKKCDLLKADLSDLRQNWEKHKGHVKSFMANARKVALVSLGIGIAVGALGYKLLAR